MSHQDCRRRYIERKKEAGIGHLTLWAPLLHRPFMRDLARELRAGTPLNTCLQTAVRRIGGGDVPAPTSAAPAPAVAPHILALARLGEVVAKGMRSGEELPDWIFGAVSALPPSAEKSTIAGWFRQPGGQK